MNSIHKIISIFLVFVLCITLVPVSASAGEELPVEVVSLEELAESVLDAAEEFAETKETEPTDVPENTSETKATELPVEAETERESDDLFVASGEYYDEFIWSLDDNGVLTISGDGESLGFPSSGSAPWLDYASRITAVVVESGLTSVGMFLFYDCTALKTIYLPDTIKIIYWSSFGHCEALQEVLFEGTREQWDGIDIKDGNEYLTNASLQCSVSGTEGEGGTFGDGLSWTLSDAGILTISGSGSMTDFTDVMQVPWCDLRSRILSVIISDGVDHIGSRSFQDCKNLTSVELPDGVVTLNAHAFSGCTALKEIWFPDSLMTIQTRAFSGCTSLSRVELPAKMTMLGEYAFSGCTSLAEVTVPTTMKTIASYAFENCGGIQNVYYDASADSWSLIRMGTGNECLTDAVFHYQFKSGVPEIVNVQLKKDEIGFYIFDYVRKTPVSGAEVKINGETLVSGADGSIKLSLNTGSYSFSLACEGYESQNITLSLVGGELYVLSMKPEAVNPTALYVELSLKDSPSGTNVLAQKAFLTEGSDAEYYLRVAGAFSDGYVSKYCFYQNGEVALMITANGESEGSVTITADTFQADVPIYVKAIGSDGSAGSMQLTNLIVNKDTSRLSENSVSLGSEITVPVDEDVPFVGGESFTLGLDELPVYMYTDGDIVRIAVNYYEAEYEEGKDLEHGGVILEDTTWEALKQSAMTEMNPYNFEGSVMTGAPKKVQFGASGKVEFKVWGCLEGSLSTGDVSGIIRLVSTVTVENMWQMSVGPMPMVITLGIEAELDGTIKYTTNIDTWADLGITGIVNPSFTITAGIGPGFAKVMSLTLNGSGKASVSCTWEKDKERADLVELTGSLGVKLKILFAEYTKDFLKDTWVIYDSTNGRSLSLYSDEDMLSAAMDGKNYTLAGRDYLEEMSPWLGEVTTWSRAGTTSETVKTLQSSIYEDTRLEIVQSGDTTMAFFLTDNAQRADVDRTMLVYTVYDPDSGTWSAPVAVADDGTADFYPSVCGDESGIYLAWANMKESVGDVDVLDAEALVSGVEIVVAKFENGAFSTVTVTEDEYLDNIPAVWGDSVVWVKSKTNNLLGNDGGGILCLYDEENVKELKTVSNVTELAMGELNGELCIALVEDVDGDFATMDRIMTLLALDGSTLQTVGEGNMAEIAFESGLLCWCENGKLQALGSIGAAPEAWMGLESVVPGPWQTVEAGNRTYLMFLGNVADEENEQTDVEVFTYIHDGENWSDAVRLTELGLSTRRFEACAVDGSVHAVAAVSDLGRDAAGMTEAVSLCSFTVVECADYALKSFDYEDVTASGDGFVLPFTAVIANNGAGNGEMYTLELRRGEKIVSTVSRSGVSAGGRDEFSGTFALESLPEREGQYTVYVCAGDGEDSNNGKDITLGLDDLAVELADYSIADGYHALSLSVQNKGLYETEAVLTVRYGSAEGEEFLADTAAIAAGDAESFLVTFDTDDLEFSDSALCMWYEVTSAHEDAFEADNGDFFVVHRPETYQEHTEHVPVAVPAVEPTCTKGGFTEGSACGICGEVLAAQEAIPASGHSYESHVTAPTCTEQGYATHTCTACGHSHKDRYVPAAHTWDEGEITRQPAIGVDGEMVYTCTACGETMTEILPRRIGDVDGNGEINVFDLVQLMKYLIGAETDVAESECDTNRDGSINIQDAVYLVKTLAADNP